MTRTLVVGGGASGAALAARLSEDPDRIVTLLEAGRADGVYPDDLLDSSSVRGAMPGHPANWSYQGLLTADLPYTIARGRILGGSSTINGACFVRARHADQVAWQRAGGDAWSPERLLSLWRALEHDHDYGARPRHGDAGPMPVRRPAATNPATRAFMAAALDLGFGLEPDKNGDQRPGVGPVPANIVDGVRVNTALAYLEPVRSRPNLRIVGGTRALRVRCSGARAVGVDTDRGPLDADEVVLCAGAIGSAHLLLVSGVGPAGQLQALGIPVVSSLPVGAGFADHPDIAVGWRPRRAVMDPGERVPFPAALNFDSSGPAGRHPDGDLELLLSVKSLGYLLTGSARTTAGGVAAVLRHPIRTVRAVGGISVGRAMAQVSERDDLQLIVGLQAPVGRGTLSLESADPRRGPRIAYRYLEESYDLHRMRLGVRTAVQVLRSSAFEGIVDDLTELSDRVLDDDDALDRWMRAHLGTAIHMCATAPMGEVVDGSGRVHGVTGLRVADTSILPEVPSRGPFASAVLIGELLGRRMRDGG